MSICGQFQSGHFNGDSSSDEEAFSKDLVFTETEERNAAVLQGLSSYISQAETSKVRSVSLLANVISATADDNQGTSVDIDINNDDYI